MEKLKSFLISKTVVDIIILISLMFLFAFLFGKPYGEVLVDRGREFLISQEILKGHVPYKDITLVYFPFSYYINAIIYKFFGVFINSITIVQTFVCTVFVILFYFLSREFLSRKVSLGLSILVITSSIFGMISLFSFILPYSYARIYGVLGYWLAVFSLVKLFKTDDTKYLYLGALATGFTVCCKLEFLSALLLFIIGLFLYKKLKLYQYLKALLLFLLFPLTNVGILIYQGVTFNEILEAVKFGIAFSKTPAMLFHLKNAGMYPNFSKANIGLMFTSIIFFYKVIFLVFISLYLKQKYKNILYFFIPSMLLLWILYNEHNLMEICWFLLPIFISVLFLFNIKRIFKDDKMIFLLFIATIILSQREYFGLNLYIYGTYSFPLLMLTLLVFIEKYVPKILLNVKIKYLLGITLVIFSCVYLINYRAEIKKSEYRLETHKGVVYTGFKPVVDMFDYVNNKIPKNSSVLILPEGAMINFLTGRKVDMRCFMMDRLYHDAYGAEKAKDMVAQTESDYIILLKGFYFSDFGQEYLYEENSSVPVAKYIFENYKEIQSFKDENGSVKIMKKK